jgi:hypothetical protein
MKITIEFEHEEEAIEALNGVKYFQAITDADNYLRSCLKHGDNPDNVIRILEHARELLRSWKE